MWVVNQRQSKWQSALPQETADLLNSARDPQSSTLEDIASQVTGAINERLGTGEPVLLGLPGYVAVVRLYRTVALLHGVCIRWRVGDWCHQSMPRQHSCCAPSDVCADIGGADTLGLQDYPFISTGVANYSPELTRLLSQQGNWQVVQLAPQLAQFLAGTNITVRQQAAAAS